MLHIKLNFTMTNALDLANAFISENSKRNKPQIVAHITLELKKLNVNHYYTAIFVIQ